MELYERIVIIGGGLTGLTLAYLLSKKNINATVLKKYPQFSKGTSLFQTHPSEPPQTNLGLQASLTVGQHLILRVTERDTISFYPIMCL